MFTRHSTRKPGKYFLQLLLSISMIVFAVFFILITGIYAGSNNKFKDSSILAKKMLVSQISRNISSQIRYFDNMMLNLSADGEVTKFFTKNHINNSVEDIILTRALINKSNNIQLSYLGIDGLYFYSSKNKNVVRDYRTHIDSYKDDLLKSMINQTDEFKIFAKSVHKSDTIKKISIVRNFPVATDVKIGSIIMEINMQYLSDIINDMLKETRSEFLIVLPDNSIVCITGTEILINEVKDNPLLLDDFSGVNTYFIDSINEEAIIFSEKNSASGLSFIYTIPESVIFEPYNDIKDIITLLIVIISFIAVGLIFYISSILYSPIKKMLFLFSEESLSNNNRLKMQDEFLNMENYFRTLSDANLQLEHKIEENLPSLRKYFLYSLLTDHHFENKFFEKGCKEYNVEMQFDLFTVVTCEIDCLDDETIRFEQILFSKIKQILCGDSAVYDIKNFPGRVSFLINHNLECSIKSTLQSIINHEDFKFIKINFGVGDTYNNCLSIYRSYYLSISVLNFLIFHNKNHNVCTIIDIEDYFDFYFYPFEYEKELTNYLTAKNKDAVLQLIRKISSDTRITSELQSAKDIILQLLSCIFRFICLNGKNLADFVDEQIAYSRIKKSDNIEELILILQQYSLNAITFLSINFGDQFEITLSKLIDFIDNNYFKEITITDLSKMVYLSPSYLSRIFKSHTGKTLNEYITFKRIENAKTILKEPQLSVKKVGELMGYSSNQSFLRNFKQIEGITPTEYRCSIVRNIKTYNKINE